MLFGIETNRICASIGEVSEWSKEHAWKACIRQRIEGSNPSLTAIYEKAPVAHASGAFSYMVRVGEKLNGSTNAPAFGPRKRPEGVKIPEAMVFSVYPVGKDPKWARITHASNYPIIFKRFFLCDQCFCRQGALYFLYIKVCYPTILN